MNRDSDAILLPEETPIDIPSGKILLKLAVASIYSILLGFNRRLSLYQSGPSSPPVNPVEQIDPQPGTFRDYSMEIGGCCKRYYLLEFKNVILISCVVSFKFC